MFIQEGIIIGIHGGNPQLMKTRKIIVIKEARLLWRKLLNEGWQKTNPRWLKIFLTLEFNKSICRVKLSYFFLRHFNILSA